MDEFYLRAVQGIAGCKTIKDAKVAEVRARFSRDFDSSINVVYDALRNDVQQDLIITPTNEENKFTVFARPGEELKIGDILYWNGLHWLMTDIAFDDDIYTTGTMVRCNRQISWMNDMGQVIKRWCLTTKPYTANVNVGNVVTMLNGKYDVKLSYDDETLAVPIGKRFLLDIVGGKPMCYKLDFADVNTNKYTDIDGGFIEWNLVSDEFNHNTDSVEMMLCDCLGDKQKSDAAPVGCSIHGSATIKAGYTNTYSPLFLDSESNKADVTPVWSVELSDSGDASDIKYSVSGEKLILEAKFVESIIGHSVKITLSDADGKYDPVSMTVKVVSVYD